MQNMHDGDSPVDNQTYNLLQILTSKLEAVEAYQLYEEDLDGEALKVVQRIAKDDREHVTKLLGLLGISTGVQATQRR